MASFSRTSLLPEIYSAKWACFWGVGRAYLPPPVTAPLLFWHSMFRAHLGHGSGAPSSKVTAWHAPVSSHSLGLPGVRERRSCWWASKRTTFRRASMWDPPTTVTQHLQSTAVCVFVSNGDKGRRWSALGVGLSATLKHRTTGDQQKIEKHNCHGWEAGKRLKKMMITGEMTSSKRKIQFTITKFKIKRS